ncbi:Endonuclease/exonuclease/phosphatase, partial [Lentinula raphanica]
MRARQHLNAEQVRENTKKIKAHLKIASINIKGRGAESISHAKHKWREIYGLMLRNKIAILAVQETHLSLTQVTEINQSWFGKKLLVFNTIDPDHTNAAGTAIVLNRDLVNANMAKVYYIVPGRALCLKIPWYKNDTLTILVTYAPNDSMTSNKLFWELLTDEWLKTMLPVPDIFLGDHNLVEEGFDRTTGKADNYEATAAFVTFKSLFIMKDGWRKYNPDTREFTHTHWGPNGQATMSRLDRIYLREDLIKYSRSWEISDELGELTDHRLVLATILTPGLPYQGPGRYTIRPFILDNSQLITELMDLCIAASQSMETCLTSSQRTEGYNPQVIHEKLKADIIKTERAFSKKFIGTAKAKIESLQLKKKDMLKAMVGENEQEATEIAKIQVEINKASSHLRSTRAANSRLRKELEDDGVTKSSVSYMKEQKTRDMIMMLKAQDWTPEHKSYARRSDEMTEIARTYHASTQEDESE